jgi:Flp pilus assembly protein TadG
LLPLLAISFGLLDYMLGIFIQNTLRNAVREGVRFAVTQQTAAGGQDAAIKTVIKHYSMGFLNDAALTSTPPAAAITIQYFPQGSTTPVTGNGSNAQGNICVIVASINHSWMAPLWNSTGVMTFSAASSDVMEAPPGGVLPGR